MQFRKTLIPVLLAALMSAAALPALAADGDGMQSFAMEAKTMADKNGMVSRQDFLKMMGKRFDAMDKSKKGMLSVDDLMHIFSDKTGS